MSVATTVSRVTGFARDWSLAVALGVTLVSSAYTVSNNIPNMIYELVAGGVLSGVFIPIFIERMEIDGEEQAWRFASAVLNVSVIALGILAVAGTIFAEAFVRTQTIGAPASKTAEFIELGTFMFRFFAVQVVIYGVTAVTTGILNSYRKFVAPAVGPIFNNLVVIATVLGGYLPLHEREPRLALIVLAAGTTLGVLAQFAVQIPSLLKVGLRYHPVLDLNTPVMRSMGRKMLATVIYVATNMVHVSLRNSYAIQAAEGAVGPAAVRYAWMFYQLPYGIFAVALATAMMPELASAAGVKDTEGFKSQFRKGFGATAVLMLPMAAMLVALAPQVVTLLQAGRFTASDVPLVAGVLRYWSLGLFSFAAYMYTIRAYYALQDTRTPMLTNIAATVLHVGLYSVLTLGAGGWAGIGLRGIGLADAITYTVHVLALFVILRLRLGTMKARLLVTSMARVLAASVAGGGVAWGVARLLDAPLSDVPLGFLVQLAVAGAAGLVVSFGLAAAFRVPEMTVARQLAGRFTARLAPKRGPR